MNQAIQVTVLVENSVHVGGLTAEHGLSFYLQAGGQNILFDAGQTDLLLGNARKLGIDLTRVDTVVLSHGHYDHTGGFDPIRSLSPRARIFAHPDALSPKYTRNADGSARFIGMRSNVECALRDNPCVFWTSQATEIGHGIWVTGPIPRQSDFENVGGSFFQDENCRQPDPLRDDQALFFMGRQSVQVILGCAHAGVVNTLHYIQQLAGGKPIHTVMGGMHLLTASQERVERTLAALRQMGVERIAPVHCTGSVATAALWTAFPGKCLNASTGSRITFEADV